MTYAIGDRIELVRMDNDPDPITRGTRGTIDYIGAEFQGQRQLGVDWDNGRALMVLLPADVIRKVAA